MIPKIIHQIWFQGQRSLPEKYANYQRGWQELHPDFQYKLWDEHSIRSLIKTDFSWFIDTWESLTEMIQKIDSAKIFILYKFGGVVADMDMEAVQSVEGMLDAPIIFSQCYVHWMGLVCSFFLGLKQFTRYFPIDVDAQCLGTGSIMDLLPASRITL